MSRKLMTYNVATGATNEPELTGLTGFMNYGRLARLIADHEGTRNEPLIQLTFTDKGLRMVFGRKKAT